MNHVQSSGSRRRRAFRRNGALPKRPQHHWCSCIKNRNVWTLPCGALTRVHPTFAHDLYCMPQNTHCFDRKDRVSKRQGSAASSPSGHAVAHSLVKTLWCCPEVATQTSSLQPNAAARASRSVLLPPAAALLGSISACMRRTPQYRDQGNRSQSLHRPVCHRRRNHKTRTSLCTSLQWLHSRTPPVEEVFHASSSC